MEAGERAELQVKRELQRFSERNHENSWQLQVIYHGKLLPVFYAPAATKNSEGESEREGGDEEPEEGSK